MRKSCILPILPLLLLTHHAGAAPKKATLPATTTVAGLPVTVDGGFVNVDAGETDVLSHDALTPFTAFLKAYPRARSFGLSWYEAAGMGGDSAAVRYDRVKHTVTVDYIWGGGDDPEHEGKVVFTRVSESVFAAILKAHPKGLPQDGDASWKPGDDPFSDDDAGEWGGFQYLFQPRYGCRVSVVKRHRHRHSRHGARRRG